MGLPWVLETGLGEPAESRGDLWSTWGAVSLKPPLGAWPKLGETFGDEGEAWERLPEQKTQLGLQGPTEGCPFIGCGVWRSREDSDAPSRWPVRWLDPGAGGRAVDAGRVASILACPREAAPGDGDAWVGWEAPGRQAPWAGAPRQAHLTLSPGPPPHGPHSATGNQNPLPMHGTLRWSCLPWEPP